MGEQPAGPFSTPFTPAYVSKKIPDPLAANAFENHYHQMERPRAGHIRSEAHSLSRWESHESGRRFVLFLAVSVATHLVFFFGLSLSPQSPPATAHATVQEFDLFQPQPPPVVEPPVPPEVIPPPEPEEEPQRVRRRVRRPEPEPPTPPAEPPASDQLTGEGSTPDAPAVAEASVVSTEGGLAVGFREGNGQGGAARGSGSLPALPAAEPEPAFDLRAAIRRYMRLVQREIGMPPYPRSARRAGIEGTVMIGIAITPTGAVRAVRVKRSSGHERLDEAALAFLRQLSQVPAPPRELAWNTREVTLPISYRPAPNR